MKPKVIDLFCGIGGLSHGFVLEEFDVVAGIDADPTCKYPFEANNKAQFIHKSIEDLAVGELKALYGTSGIKILVGCAPCQPFSSYSVKSAKKGGRWKLLYDFSRLIEGVEPDVVSMENVTRLKQFDGGQVYKDYVANLERNGYHVTSYDVYCPDYGIPQRRTRLVLFASKIGPVELIEKTHAPENYVSVRDVIGTLEPLEHGQISADDSLHAASKLTEKNVRRIRQSKPGGTWRDWDKELIAECHAKETGRSYGGVYGRMKWEEPSPTITTQCYGFGNGRFGHPEQDRAISLREAALLQTFPYSYRFLSPGERVQFKRIGRFIGNAVPVDLGRVIAKSIRQHIEVN